MDSDVEVETQGSECEDIYTKEKKKGTIKECTVNLSKLANSVVLNQPAKISSRPIRNSNDENIQTVSTIDYEEENLNYEADTSDEYDLPNNCYTPEDFYQNRQVLINVVNTMINKFQVNDHQPFYIERTIEGGIRAGTWALNRYQSNDGNSYYIIVKVNDNNRILQAKEIESMCFFPSLTPAKNSKEEKTGRDMSNDMTKSAIEQDEQMPTVEDINNEYDTEIKVECGGDDDNEQNYEAYSVEITPKTEDAVADEVDDVN